ncbi:MAG: manganese efflux pump [Clostridia bacterium]|nr:manganese efflux pump [Clostridia bacterium]
MDLLFLLNSAAFGVGLAMDAFSVSLANGLNEPQMRKRRMLLIAGVFALFQTAMPLIGYFCVRLMAQTFAAFRPWIPWIALALLLYLGGSMLLDGIRKPKKEEAEIRRLSGAGLLLQGVATSIDALSVGFTTAELPWKQATAQALIIGAVTFAVCIGGVLLGKAFGMKLARKASILGGVILIGIGIEIFVTGILK